MSPPISWQTEFAKVIGCNKCNTTTDHNLLRDDGENVPQPGYIGPLYHQSHVLLIGQNPGTPKTLAVQDRPYTKALRALRDELTSENYDELSRILKRFILQWPVHGQYFPLVECGLTLDDIAYCNVVRCRTAKDKSPNLRLSNQCITEHLSRWIRLLAPHVVVFIGKRAAEHGGPMVDAAGVPYAFMNRQRSLSTEERATNRANVVALVRKHRG